MTTEIAGIIPEFTIGERLAKARSEARDDGAVHTGRGRLDPGRGAGSDGQGVMTAVVWFVRAFGPFAFGLVLVLLVVAR